MQGQKCYDKSAKPEGCENTREGTFKSDWENWGILWQNQSMNLKS